MQAVTVMSKMKEWHYVTFVYGIKIQLCHLLFTFSYKDPKSQNPYLIKGNIYTYLLGNEMR